MEETTAVYTGGERSGEGRAGAEHLGRRLGEAASTATWLQSALGIEGQGDKEKCTQAGSCRPL